MKNIVTIIVTAILGAITLAIVLSISGRMNRSMELKSNLSSVVEGTVSTAVSKKYVIRNTDEYIADIVMNLSEKMDTRSDIRVNVLKSDKEKGILAIRILEEFEHPNGRKGTTGCERTVVLDHTEEPKTGSCLVKFYLTREDLTAHGGCYKQYILQEGDAVIAPDDPAVDGKRFAGWKDANDYIADFSLPVEQDRVYYADWR